MSPNCNHGAELLPVQNLASVTIVKVTKHLIKVTETTKKKIKNKLVQNTSWLKGTMTCPYSTTEYGLINTATVGL